MDRLTFAPVELTLYGENDEPENTYSKSVIRWGVLKKALKLAEQLRSGQESEKGGLTDESLDALNAFVCQLFNDQFTPKQLEEGADIAEVMACFRTVVNRASAMGNA